MDQLNVVLTKKVFTMDVYHDLPKRNLPLFSSYFALALRICLYFYFFFNFCIHVGIYCCLMSHTSMITSEISQIWESPANEVIHSLFLVVFIKFLVFFFSRLINNAFSIFCFLNAQNIRSVFLIQCLHFDHLGSG